MVSMKFKLTVVIVLLIQQLLNGQTAVRNDIVIDEIMADPSPGVGLPNAEFIELKNVSHHSFNLNGWRIGDASGFTTINSNFILQPDSFVLLCTNSNFISLSVFGIALGLSNFPSLDNNTDQIYLQSKEGRIIHAVNYSSDWYQNSVKKEGGWTLEMIDTHNACSGKRNWIASKNLKGGTPGLKNSVDDTNPDLQPPSLVAAFATDSNHITLLFDEPLDSISAAMASNYSITDGVGLAAFSIVNPPSFETVQIKISTPLLRNKIYHISVNNISDCAGNVIGAYNKVKLGWAAPVIDSFGLVINEILFNPKPDGVDYVELYNRSNNIVDIKDCYIANRTTNGNMGALKQLCSSTRLLFPGEYLVITENAETIRQQYPSGHSPAFNEIKSMPSFPDDKGSVLIINAQGTLIDELQYDERWHFKLIDNDEGVALERIDYNKPAQDAANWHSASTQSGFGTPGYQNSQYRSDVQLPGSIGISPSIFSPDNDGFDDFLTINYQFPDPGYVCNITIFDAVGRPVRYLTHNAICGLNGTFRWDGLSEKNERLSIGLYIVLTEVFNAKGKTNRFKNAVTLARKL